MMFLYIIMARSSYIIIVSGMGDDVPIWGALVTLFDNKGYLLFLMMFLYICMVYVLYQQVANLYAKVTYFSGGRLIWYMGQTSGKSLREGPTFRYWQVTMDSDILTKSIVMFLILVGIWVVIASLCHNFIVLCVIQLRCELVLHITSMISFGGFLAE